MNLDKLSTTPIWLMTLALTVALIFAAPVLWSSYLNDNFPYWSGRFVSVQDLDVIRSAVSLYEAREKPLNGTSLKPLVGRYLQELELDRWGRPYRVDTSVGFLCSYGEDNYPGGSGPAADGVVYYKGPLRIRRCQYRGAFGPPPSGAQIIITMNKAFELVDENELMDRLMLLTASGKTAMGGPISLTNLNLCPGHCWELNLEKTKPKEGVIVFENTEDLSELAPPITPKMAFNFDTTEEAIGNNPLERFGLREVPLAGGPLDPKLFGLGTIRYLRRPDFDPLYESDGESFNRGVRIEKLH